MNLKEFGEYFSEIRTREGYKSQRSLAEDSGISYSTISRIELGQHKANPETLRELANCFVGVSYEELLQNAGYTDFESLPKNINSSKLSEKYDDLFERLKGFTISVKNKSLLNFIKHKKLSYDTVAANLDKVTSSEFENIVHGLMAISLENALKISIYYRLKFSDTFNIRKIGTVLSFVDENSLMNELDGIVLFEKSRYSDFEPNSIGEFFSNLGNVIATGLESDDFIKIPIYGEVKAGYGMIGDENIIGYQMESKSRVDDGEYFYLLVKGDSMIEDGIIDGCRVLVRRQNTVPNGKIGVIIINSEEATLKRVFYDGDKVILQASNKSIPPKTYDISEVLIQGQVKSFVVDI